MLSSLVPAPRPFQTLLPIPAMLTPTRTDETTDYYEITQRPAMLDSLPGLPTPAWTYHGSFPGPRT